MIDFIEGNLDGLTLEKFEKFISQNIDIKEEIDHYINDNIKLYDNTELENRNELKFESLSLDDNMNMANYQEYIVSGMQNDLEDSDKKKKSQFLKHNNLEQEEAVFSKIKLQPYLTEKLDIKSDLKKSYFKFYKRFLIPVVAASVFLFFIIQVFYSPDKPEPNSGPKVEQLTKLEPNYKVKIEVNSDKNKETEQLKLATTKSEYTAFNRKEATAKIESSDRKRSSINKLPIMETRLLVENHFSGELIDKKPGIKKKDTEEYYTLDKFVEYKIHERIKASGMDFNQNGKLDFWEIMDKTAKQINEKYEGEEGKKIIDTKFNDEGELIAFDFNTALIKISRQRN